MNHMLIAAVALLFFQADCGGFVVESATFNSTKKGICYLKRNPVVPREGLVPFTRGNQGVTYLRSTPVTQKFGFKASTDHT